MNEITTTTTTTPGNPPTVGELYGGPTYIPPVAPVAPPAPQRWIRRTITFLLAVGVALTGMLALGSSANAAEAKPADHTYVTNGEVQPIHHRQGAVRVKADCKAGDTPVSVKAATRYGGHVHTIATGLKLDKGRGWAKVQIGHGFALVRADVTCKVAPHGR